MDKRDKFKIVTEDEFNSESNVIDNIEIVDVPEEVNVDRIDDIEENKMSLDKVEDTVVEEVKEEPKVEVNNQIEISNEPYV